MNPIYHLQVGWLAGNIGNFDRRERRILMVSAVIADLDGIFFWNRELFERVHHTFGHNVFFGIIVGAVMAAIARRGRRIWMFVLSYLMALLEIPIDLITAPEWPLRFLWPISPNAYYLTDLLGITPENVPAWDFALEKVVQLTLMLFLVACAVFIYIKYKRTFIELISWRLDLFLTDFAILPFKHKCEFPDCRNRAHYHCEDTGSLRCIKHCKIHRNLSITCADLNAKAG